MSTWLDWAMAGAWLYCVLRLEKVAYDLKQIEHRISGVQL